MKNNIKRIKALMLYSKMVKRISNKSKMLDMLCSRLFLGVPFPLYIDLAFYNKAWKERNNYIINDVVYCTRFNCGATPETIINKSRIIKITRHFLNRRLLFTSNLSYVEFENFLIGLKSFFYKPDDGCSGIGIEKFNISENTNIKVLYDKIKSFPNGIIEETIVQHKELDKLCPNLLQTIRFTVFKHKDGPRILFATIKTSARKDAIVDNAHGGGIYANINLSTGRIQTNAFRSIDKFEDLDNYDIRLFSEEGLEKHPVTGTMFKGFQIPFFEEAKNLVIEITRDVDFFGRRLIGYDIAITDNGPMLIEANINIPGINNVWQTACKDIPLRSVLENTLKE